MKFKYSSFWMVKLANTQKRMGGMLIGFVSICVLLSGVCVYRQGLDPKGQAAEAIRPDLDTIRAIRGTITDRNGEVLAESLPAQNIIADPIIVSTNGKDPKTWIPADGQDPEPWTLAQRLKAKAGPGIIAGILATHLDGDFQSYYEGLTRTTREDGTENKYALLASSVLTYTNISLKQSISELGYKGIYWRSAPVRSYPNGSLAANVLGYMLSPQDEDPAVGGGGLEYRLNSQLAGVDGKELNEWTPYGRIPTRTSIIQEPQEGISYELTLDIGLQYMQDQRLAAAVESSGARSGTAITMTMTGEVLAMSSYPTFDPNNRFSTDSSLWENPVIRDAYEPGSVQKVLTMAALIDSGAITPDTRVVAPGRIASADTFIGDAWTHDTMHWTATGVLVDSSNVGTIVLTRQIPKELLVSYLTDFGLGSPTGVGLPGEESGSTLKADMSDQTRDNIAFGQGLSVTVMQEATAIASIANGGVYVSPKIIRSAKTSQGVPIEQPAQTVRRVISEESSKTVLEMMENVALAHKDSIYVEGYRIATKSGTAEVPANGGYKGTIVSYVGIAPAEDPFLVTLVVLNHPSSGSGTSQAAPVVQDILKVSLPRYGIAPSTTSSVNLPIHW